jgi:shikimate dehydrogenase
MLMERPARFLMAAVMGWPVMHSRSPLLHSYWFERYGLKGAYVPLLIEPGKLEPALRSLHPLGFSGCNLTIPHKQDALAIVDEIDPVARAIGAISCVIVREEGSLLGTNNDCFGFIENIREAAPDWRPDGGPAYVIGAGGGARAVVYGLLQEGVKELRLVNRTRERAEVIAREFGGPITVVDWADRSDALAGCNLAVNATSQGMQGMAALDLALDHLPAGALAADIIYIPGETPFLAAARLRGNRTVNGLGMLLHQGRPAWRAWFNRDVEVTADLRKLIEASL